MAPLILALDQHPDIHHTLCVSGQHTQMLSPILELFGLTPSVNLEVMHQGQTLNTLTSRVVHKMDAVLEQTRPDHVLVHGDTTTAMSAALAAFHARISVAHIEAGLRTGNLSQPFPEEMNRRVIDSVSDLLFAPTLSAKSNLIREKLSGRCWITGNTVIDALAKACELLDTRPKMAEQIEKQFDFLHKDSRLILVTGHRRENFGDGMINICTALLELSREQGVEIIYPVHLNPQIKEPVQRHLGGAPNIHLVPPADYLAFIWLMRRASIILTDSGGIQEEAPYLKKPVLVMRDVTERPEAIANGTAQLVGTDSARIVHHVRMLLTDSSFYDRFCSGVNPYGDGLASERIVTALLGEPVDEFVALDEALASRF